MPSLWTRSYYVDTVGVLREDTTNYIEQQKRESKYFNQTHA